jgi:hypothetical protein
MSSRPPDARHLEYASALVVMLSGHIVAAQATHDNAWLTDARGRLQHEMRVGFVPPFRKVQIKPL